MNEALNIRSKISANTKKTLSIAFYCLYCACKLLRVNITHLEIARWIKFPFKNINDSLKKYSHPSSHYKIPVYDPPVICLIEFYCEKISEMELIPSINSGKIQRFYQRCEASGEFEKAFRQKPHFVAASIVQYYCVNVYSDVVFRKSGTPSLQMDWYEVTLISENVRVKLIRIYDEILSD